LEAAVEALNGESVEFVVTLGDLIDRDFKSFSAVMPIYGKLKAPHYPVLGNHEFTVEDGDKAKVEAAVGLEKPYSSRSFGSWRFLFMDGTDMAVYRYAAGDPRLKVAKELFAKFRAEGRKEAQGHNGACGEGQMKWISDELVAAGEAKQRVILFNHFPVFPDNGSNLWNSREIVELLSSHKHVAAYMNGHIHSGNYAEREGIHYVNFKGMVETEVESAYAVVECHADRMVIEGYGLEPDRDLGFT